MLIGTPPTICRESTTYRGGPGGVVVREGLVGTFLAAVYVLPRGRLMPILCKRERKVLG
jgi:hypothetical protein